MGVSEVRWKDGGDFVIDGYSVMYAGGPTCQRGVAVIAEAKVAERVTEIDRFGDRIYGGEGQRRSCGYGDGSSIPAYN